jgi:hypothetical protein
MRKKLVSLVVLGLAVPAFACTAPTAEEEEGTTSDAVTTTATGVAATPRRFCANRDDLVTKVPASGVDEVFPLGYGFGLSGSNKEYYWNVEVKGVTTWVASAFTAWDGSNDDSIPFKLDYKPNDAQNRALARQNLDKILRGTDTLCERHIQGTTTADQESSLAGAKSLAEAHLKATGACDILTRRCAAIQRDSGTAGRALATGTSCHVDICSPTPAATAAALRALGATYIPKRVIAHAAAECTLCKQNPNPPPHEEG